MAAADRFQDVEPAHARHLDVEQHQRERSLRYARKRRRAILGDRDSVTMMRQPPGQHVPVHLVVVDDEQRFRPWRSRSESRGQAPTRSSIRAAATPPASCRSRRTRPPGPCADRLTIACAVSAMTGMCRVASSAFRRRVASQPSISGRLMSMRIRSGATVCAVAMPSGSVVSRNDLVSFADQAPRQHVPVHFVVFDEEDSRHPD